MTGRKRFKTYRGLAIVTGTAPTTIIPSSSGIAPAILQVCIHNKNGDLREVRMDIGPEEFFTMGIGASGTIIWDMQDQEEIPIGSGFSAYIVDTIGTAANVAIMARYVKYDERAPRSQIPGSYVPSTTRKPNYEGDQ
jgi:hypothetical protein